MDTTDRRTSAQSGWLVARSSGDHGASPKRAAARGRRCAVGAMFFAALASGGAHAQAQNFLDALFGNFGRPASPEGVPAETRPQATPTTPGLEGGSESHYRSVAFCVRLCDGRYFPMHRQSGVNPVQLCGALCPASATKIFWGNEISRAVAGDGTRYSDTENALVYRKRLVPGCTCNGTNFGLAPIAAGQDPTVRPGDLQSSGSKR